MHFPMHYCKMQTVAKRLCDCSYSIFAHSASAVTASEKVQLTLLGSPLHAFQLA